MISIDTKTPLRFTPPWLEGQPDAPVYLLRAGSVMEREMLEADLAGEHRAARVYPFQLRGAFENGVDALIGEDDPDGAARLKEIAAAEYTLEAGESLPADEAVMLAGAREVIAEHYPTYRSLIAQDQRREAIAPIVAFRKFCVGWENVDATYARGPDGLVKLDALADISPLDLRMAGRTAYGMLYGGGHAKN